MAPSLLVVVARELGVDVADGLQPRRGIQRAVAATTAPSLPLAGAGPRPRTARAAAGEKGCDLLAPAAGGAARLGRSRSGRLARRSGSVRGGLRAPLPGRAPLPRPPARRRPGG